MAKLPTFKLLVVAVLFSVISVISTNYGLTAFAAAAWAICCVAVIVVLAVDVS